MTRRQAFASDLRASPVVFLVALPLCLGVAIASGAPPAAGLITGIVGGILVGALAGCPLQVSGPAAGLVVIVWEVVAKHGMAGLGAALILAGLLQALAGFARLGRWFQAVSPAVVQGMLSSIGLLILLSQLQVMLGLTPKGNGLDNLHALASIATAAGPSPSAAAGLLGLGAIAVLWAWDKVAPRRLRALPGPLVAVAAVTAVASILHTPVALVSVPANFLDGLSFAGIAALLSAPDTSIYLAALTIAFVASAESLLCSTAVDRMTKASRTDYDRELLAQGAGNLTCGLLGGLPLTGVIVRSAANIGAGARTRMSAILHGVWLLAFVVLLPDVLSLIPVAGLAAVLVYFGFKLLNVDAIRALAAQGRSELVVFGGTVAAVVATDLLRGILFGFGLSLLRLSLGLSRLRIVSEPGPTDAAATRLQLVGSATFLSLPRLTAALEAIPPGANVVVDPQLLRYIDHACLELLRAWADRHAASGGAVDACWRSLDERLLGVRDQAAGRAA